jgi:DNA-binding XRE family transcriptional regulator
MEGVDFFRRQIWVKVNGELELHIVMVEWLHGLLFDARKKLQNLLYGGNYPMNAKQFKAARKAKGMTQKELSSHLGVSLSAVTKWEGGATVPAWVNEKISPPVVDLKIKSLSAAEIQDLEKKAAAKGFNGDSLAAELIRNWIKLSLITFTALHLYHTGPVFTFPAITSTARAGLQFLASLFS